MNNHTRRTVHSGVLPLSPLKVVLTDARKDLPPRVLKYQKDVNEDLALKLIEKMKKEYRKHLPYVNRKVESSEHGFSELSREMAGRDA